MKNKKLLFCIIFIVSSVFCTTLQAQDNYVKGYIILVNGDTVRGSIEYQNWLKSPKEISFRRNNHVYVQKHSATSIQKFYIEEQNEYYESFAGNINALRNDSRHIKEYSSYSNFLNSKKRFKADTIFLRVLVSSADYTLYSFCEYVDQESFFLKSPQGGIEELLFQSFAIINEGKKTIMSFEGYKQLIQQRMNDCKNININISYRTKQLVNLIKTYLNCKKQTIIYEYKSTKNKSYTDIGIIGGATFNQVSIRDDWKTHNISPSVMPTIGFYFEKPFSRNYQHWSFYSDIMFKQLYQKEVNNPLSSAIVSATHLKLNILGRYKFTPSQPISIYLGGGGLLCSLLKGKILSLYPYDKRGWNNFVAGACLVGGIQAKKLSVELRYETFTDLLLGTFMKTRLNSLSILLAYRLKKQ
ncbi:MAG: hypothetical protein EAZ95_14225 [Bacteroidetes bacterium]|nr:MAG: hypothetical protein EAZ95_14225 [Bacteroidota bacterium]